MPSSSLRNSVPRVVIVVSHPIQHFVSFYRALAQCGHVSTRVVYAARIGVDPYFDRDMNTEIQWNMDLLSGYEYTFLPEASTIRSSQSRVIYNPSIRSELDDSAPDVVLIYGYNHRTARIALDWCNKHRVPALMIADSELKSRRSLVRQLTKAFVLPRLLGRFSAFVTVGDSNEEYYSYYGVSRAKMFRSPFTIDESKYRRTRENRAAIRARVRQSWNLADDRTLILTVGKISERKRTKDIVEAAALCQKHESIVRSHFVIAGNGVELENLRDKVRRYHLPVLFLGFINVDKLSDVYAACDIIAHPSSKDPHPLVMSEAACIGMPLIVSDRVGAVGPTDIAREGENAIVFPVGDAAALASNVSSLAADKARIAQMGARSVEIFDELDIRRSVAGLVDAVNFCLATRE